MAAFRINRPPRREPKVQEHSSCKDHGLYYAGWQWNFLEGKQVIPGHEEPPPSICPARELEEEQGEEQDQGQEEQEQVARYDTANHGDEDCASQTVTANNFYWLRGTDGYPVAERDIREHEWLKGFSDSELESSDSDRSCTGQRRTRSTAGRGLGSWFLKTIERAGRAESL
jgi:hypothetical protein